MSAKKVDVLLVGAGVMSATLGKLLAQLDPSLKILMVERQSRVANESSHGLNNAGTGHAGYCELNYTPQRADGSIDIRRALEINAAFEMSLQFWSYLVEQGLLPAPEKFINPVYHQSFVRGAENVAFLRKRYQALHQHHLFEEMEYSEDKGKSRGDTGETRHGHRLRFSHAQAGARLAQAGQLRIEIEPHHRRHEAAR